MKVLVTGGLGFVGTHLVRELVARGADVRVLDTLEHQVHQKAPSVPDGVDLMVGDAGARAEEALDGVEAVVHLGAVVGVAQSMYRAGYYVTRNTLDTAELLEAVVTREPKLRRLVVASSMSIYGEGAYEVKGHPIRFKMRAPWMLREKVWDFQGAVHVPTPETKPLAPASVYAITKRDQEELALVMGDAYGIPTAALRFFNIYGPGQALSNPYTGAAAIFACQAMNGKAPQVFEDGRQLRDFVHVSDVVEAIVLALNSEAFGAFNVGTGEPHSILELASCVSARLGGPAPEVLNVARVGDVRHCYADPTWARGALGFRARVKLADGLNELTDYLREQARPADLTATVNAGLAVRGLVR